MRRFKTREELRQTGWTFEKDITGEYVFTHENSTTCISTNMLKNVHNLPEEVCRTDFAQYVYTDEMFTEIITPMTLKESFLKNVLSPDDYRKYLQTKLLEEVYNENYIGAKELIDELLERTD